MSNLFGLSGLPIWGQYNGEGGGGGDVELCKNQALSTWTVKINESYQLILKN